PARAGVRRRSRRRAPRRCPSRHHDRPAPRRALGDERRAARDGHSHRGRRGHPRRPRHRCDGAALGAPRPAGGPLKPAAPRGGRPPLEEAEDSGFIYYSRFFRSTTGRPPQFRAGLLSHFESFSILSLPGDANTWSVTVYIAAGDSALKGLHDLRPWTALVAA